MKKITFILLAVISCQKEQIKPISNHETFSLNAPVTIAPTTQSVYPVSTIVNDYTVAGVEYFAYSNTNVTTAINPIKNKPGFYNLVYSLGSNKLPLLVNRVINGNISNLSLTDTTGTIVYFTITINDVTGNASNVTTPNLVPFDKILPPDTDGSWKSCMWNAIRVCVSNPVCNGVCKNEASIGCLAAWSIACLWKYQIPTPVKPPIVITIPR